MTIETLELATSEAIEETKARKRKANRWKRRIITGLVSLVGATSVITNINCLSVIDKLIPGTLDYGCKSPVNWYVSQKGVCASLDVNSHQYFSDLRLNRRKIEFDLTRTETPDTESGYVDSFTRVYSGEIKLP